MTTRDSNLATRTTLLHLGVSSVDVYAPVRPVYWWVLSGAMYAMVVLWAVVVIMSLVWLISRLCGASWPDRLQHRPRLHAVMRVAMGAMMLAFFVQLFLVKPPFITSDTLHWPPASLVIDGWKGDWPPPGASTSKP